MAEDISQMGHARVVKTRFKGRPAIHKQPTTAVELSFYTQVLSQPGAAGINAPTLLACPGPREIIIEHIPHPVAMDEGTGGDVMRRLVALHQSDLNLDCVELFPFQWHEPDTARAAARFRESQRAELERELLVFWRLREALFEPIGPVSGDTNIHNWGRRANGELVLFDWERFGRASPAMDLAPLIPGLVSVARVEDYCRAYLAQCSQAPMSLADLIRQVLVACAWLVVEVVNILHDRDNAGVDEYMAWFQSHYLNWLSQARKAL